VRNGNNTIIARTLLKLVNLKSPLLINKGGYRMKKYIECPHCGEEIELIEENIFRRVSSDIGKLIKIY